MGRQLENGSYNYFLTLKKAIFYGKIRKNNSDDAEICDFSLTFQILGDILWVYLISAEEFIYGSDGQ